MNLAVVILYIPGAFLSINDELFSQIIWLGPLLLTCIVFNIALCRIRSTIRSIRIAQSNEKLALIHFLNIVIYTVLAFCVRIFEWKSNTYSKLSEHLENQYNYQLNSCIETVYRSSLVCSVSYTGTEHCA